jgi:hypothetical protein
VYEPFSYLKFQHSVHVENKKNSEYLKETKKSQEFCNVIFERILFSTWWLMSCGAARVQIWYEESSSMCLAILYFNIYQPASMYITVAQVQVAACRENEWGKKGTWPESRLIRWCMYVSFRTYFPTRVYPARMMSCMMRWLYQAAGIWWLIKILERNRVCLPINKIKWKNERKLMEERRK